MLINEKLPHYIGGIHPNCDYTHGQIFPARGVKCYQVSRASRGSRGCRGCSASLASSASSDINEDDETGCTYKHAPDIAYFNGRFYVQYLCNPKDEHTGAGVNVLASSKDGEHFEDFKISFPEYKIPKCEITDYKGLLHSFDGSEYACIHHRMCFFKASNGKMLLLSFYGLSPKPWELCWDNNGIGRVVRELNPDGSMGEIYFIRVNWQAGWSKQLLNYPLYEESTDEAFKAACDELLQNKLYVQQWAEENGDIDELIQIKHPKVGIKNEAFCWYHIDEKTIIGMWKHSRCARSDDGGQTWSPVEKSHPLVMSGQKVWGCKTSDLKYAMVYDPTMETQHRYPLCVTTSSDGLCFDNMLLVHGEVPPMRYEGFWKDLGPQYMRGIAEGLDFPPDNALWITYSVNKEDIWVAKIPVPICGMEENDIDEDFAEDKDENRAIDNWNLYSPKWTRAGLAENEADKKQYLRLTDSEPYDYAKAERIMKPSSHAKLTFKVIPRQNDFGSFYIEVCNAKAQIAARLIFRADGQLYARTVAELPVFCYEAGKEYELTMDIDCERFCYTLSINGKPLTEKGGVTPIEWKFMMAVNEVSRFVLRTGELRHTPTLDYNPDGKPETPLYGCEQQTKAATYDIAEFKAKAL